MPGVERFRRLPKAELHVHLDGSLRPATLLELAADSRVPLPCQDADSLRRYMRVDDARHLDDYLARFALTVAVLQSPAAIERVAYEMVADAAADGVRYLEVRYCPVLSRHAGLDLVEVILAERRGLLRGEREYGVRTGIINCTLRHFNPAVSEEIAHTSVQLRDQGVVGFDLAGGEAHHGAASHRHAFEIAARGGLGITVHAGEAAGASSLAEAVYDCRADRIGHGTRLIEDPALLEYIRDREIPIEINLTSNLQTRVVAEAGRHPLRAYLDRGLTVTLCSDNWLMSDVTLSSEYALATSALGVSAAELRALVLTGFRAAFLPRPERLALEAEALRMLEAEQ